ncbi:MAG: tetratricopeptide repeat protein [Pirellulales bacterium]
MNGRNLGNSYRYQAGNNSGRNAYSYRGGQGGRHDNHGRNGRHYVSHSGRYYPRNSYFFGYSSPFGRYSNPGYYRSNYGLRSSLGLYASLWPLFGYQTNYGYGYPYGYGNFGYSTYGYGGYGNGGYGYTYNPTYVSVYNPLPLEAPPEEPLLIDPAAVGEVAAEQVPPQDAGVLDFAAQGEEDFKAGRYDEAVKNWQHALVDDPQNAALLLLMGQGLFATGKYDQAAGTVQQALGVLPQDKWGVVVENYAELYGQPGDYTTQLRALEAARKKETEQPALRFLLGYQYAYLDYPKEAVRELDKLLELAPQDTIGQKMRDAMAAKVEGAAQPAANP